MSTLTPTGQNITPPFILGVSSAEPSKASSSNWYTAPVLAQGSRVEVVIMSNDPESSVREFSILLDVESILGSTTRTRTETLTFRGVPHNTVDRFDLSQGSVVKKAAFLYEKTPYEIPLSSDGKVSQILCSFLPHRDVFLRVVSEGKNGTQSTPRINYFSLQKPSWSPLSICAIYRGDPVRCTRATVARASRSGEQ